ncbi:DUF3135 domain-containing protein [Pseudomonadota bacterium]
MQLKDSTATFAFDDWKDLAETNPQAFEQKRRDFIDSFISKASSRHRNRLEGLQWRIDIERRRSSTPLSACVRISSMMLDSVYGDAGLVSALKGDLREDDSSVAKIVKISEIKQTEQ